MLQVDESIVKERASNFLTWDRLWAWLPNRFAPFDNSVFVAIVICVTIYKLVSLDFTGLYTVCGRQPLVFLNHYVHAAIVGSQCRLFFADWVPNSLASLTAILLLVFLAKKSRTVLAVGVALLVVIDTSATLWRSVTWDFSTPATLLLLLLFVPWPYKDIFGPSISSNTASNAAGNCLLVGISTYYFLAFLAKIDFDPKWAFVVELQNRYEIQGSYVGQDMYGLQDAIGRLFDGFMSRSPVIATALAAAIFLDQGLWVLAPFSRKVRIATGIITAGMHVGIALSIGTTFLTWMAIATAIGFPWSELKQRWHADSTPSSAIALAAPDRPAVALACVVASSLFYVWASVMPAVPPVYNYRVFGWRFPRPEELKTVYRLGYRDATTNGLKSIPLNHAGFMEYVHANLAGQYVEYALKAKDSETRKRNETSIETSILSFRSVRGDGWVLGDLRAPYHLQSRLTDIDFRNVDRFVLLKGAPTSGLDEHGRQGVTWTDCGTVTRAANTGMFSFSYSDTCGGE